MNHQKLLISQNQLRRKRQKISSPHFCYFSWFYVGFSWKLLRSNHPQAHSDNHVEQPCFKSGRPVISLLWSSQWLCEWVVLIKSTIKSSFINYSNLFHCEKDENVSHLFSSEKDIILYVVPVVNSINVFYIWVRGKSNLELFMLHEE